MNDYFREVGREYRRKPSARSVLHPSIYFVSFVACPWNVTLWLPCEP